MGRSAGEPLVERRAERIDVAARVGPFTARLLGGHEGGCAGDGAGERALHGAGEAEVGHDGAALLDHEVLGLEVAVDDAAFMGVVDGERRVAKEAHELGARPGPVLERGPVDEPHRDEVAPVGLADFENRGDAGMVELRGGAGFTLEAFDFAGVGASEDFQRDAAVEGGVERAPDLSAGAGAESLLEDELAEAVHEQTIRRALRQRAGRRIPRVSQVQMSVRSPPRRGQRAHVREPLTISALSRA